MVLLMSRGAAQRNSSVLVAALLLSNLLKLARGRVHKHLVLPVLLI